MNFKNNLFAIALLAASLTTASPIAATDAGSQKNEGQPSIESKRETRRQAMSYSIDKDGAPRSRSLAPNIWHTV